MTEKFRRMCEQKDMSQPKEMAETSPSKAVGKRPLPPGFEKSEVCKKLRAEAEPPNTDQLRSVQDLFAQVKAEDMEQFKGTMGAFWEITNNFLAMARKNEELHQEIAAARVVAENALKKVKDADNRAEMAEESEKAMASKNAELYQKVAAAKAMAEESDRRAVEAEKAVESWNKYFDVCCRSALKKTEESIERAEKAEKASEEWKKAFENSRKKGEESEKRAEKAEKALNDVKIALGSFAKALQDFQNTLARA